MPSACFWLENWPRAKQWIDTRDVPTQTLLPRLKPQYDDWRKKRADAAAARKSDAAKKAAEAAAHKQRLQEAGITPEGLVELIDASDRFEDPAAIAAKLAEVDVEGRHLRVYETTDPNLLLVKERERPAAAPRLCDRARRGPGCRSPVVRAGAAALSLLGALFGMEKASPAFFETPAHAGSSR